jgi:hypothetical protein
MYHLVVIVEILRIMNQINVLRFAEIFAVTCALNMVTTLECVGHLEVINLNVVEDIAEIPITDMNSRAKLTIARHSRITLIKQAKHRITATKRLLGLKRHNTEKITDS